MNLHFDLLAPWYDRAIAPPDPDRLRDLLRLPITGWLLEAGAGTGRIASLLAPHVGRLVISDLSAPMLVQARAKALACPVQAHAESLPFPDGQFDRVLVVDALHHFRDQRRALVEMVRVLKPGGRFVVEEPDINKLNVKLVALAEKLALMGSHFHPPAEIAAMATAAGCIAHIEDDSRFTAWIIGDKPMA
jgi:demethylmenaquinone methyltransferase/2-methoxy-6-polyprenyl-1,4-benzoquinol methylase